MTGLLIGVAVLAALVALLWRRAQERQRVRRTPGATIQLPIAVRRFDEIDAALLERRCSCGELQAVAGETSRLIGERRYRIVRLVCSECEREQQVYFDVTAVFH